jgi:bleomycin hydrolase
MGATQSKEPIAGEKLLIERLRALEVRDDNEYVHVDEKETKKFKAPWTAVSVSDIEHWEHELFQDPKNRYCTVHPSLFPSVPSRQLIRVAPDLHSLL